MKKVIKWLLILVVLGAAGYFGYQFYLSRTQTSAEASTTAYTQVAVATGDLEKSVTGTGSLSISQTQNVTLEFPVTISEALVVAGDSVAEGQEMYRIDPDALQTTIDSLQTELETAESEIVTLSSDYSSAEVIKYGIKGRVKLSYLEAGRQIEDIMAEYGKLLLLSLDGTMRVEIPAGDLAIDDVVKVRAAAGTTAGVVAEVNGDTAVISFTDTYALQDEEVQVLTNDLKPLGSAAAQIHMPYWVTSTAKGYVSIAYVEINAKVYKASRMVYLTNVPTSDEYAAQVKERERLTNLIQSAKALQAGGVICAPVAGIVNSALTASTVEQAENTVLASLYVGDAKQMIVSVDELDIINVAVGQNVDIVMDAISDKTYSATVSYVSQIGTTSSGVTVYDVTLDIAGDDQLRIGMNGTATIKIEQVTGVLLVPITALNSSRDGQYVWLYDASITAESGDDPGVKTFVTTGLSDETYAEVTSGLSEGDVVLVTREASTSSTSSTDFGGGMMDFANMGGGDMPSMPSGGGSAPSGGGNGGGRQQ